MSDENPFAYYGPSSYAYVSLNSILNLPATGREQDWEIELADPDRIAEFLDFFETGDLRGGQPEALASLIIGSFEKAEAGGEVDASLLERASAAIAKSEEVLRRMQFFWIDRPGVDEVSPVVCEILTVRP